MFEHNIRHCRVGRLCPYLFSDKLFDWSRIIFLRCHPEVLKRWCVFPSRVSSPYSWQSPSVFLSSDPLLYWNSFKWSSFCFSFIPLWNSRLFCADFCSKFTYYSYFQSSLHDLPTSYFDFAGDFLSPKHSV